MIPLKILSLSLLVLGINTTHPNHSFAVNDLAFITNFLDRSSNFHEGVLVFICSDTQFFRG